jgi:hypothetical protein
MTIYTGVFINFVLGLGMALRATHRRMQRVDFKARMFTMIKNKFSSFPTKRGMACLTIAA